jgi:5-methylcytosine-specific restriction endonuclease McrA
MNEKLCTWCKKPFEPSHFNQKLCSEDCKIASKKDVKKRYKQTEKGKATNDRWIDSERRKENEKRYKSTPHARKLAVERTRRYAAKHPEKFQLTKSVCDKKYTKTPHGKSVRSSAAATYRKTDKGKTVQKNHKYQLRNPKAGKIDREAWNEKLKSCGGKCMDCGTTEDITIDHIIPLSTGGSNHITNLQPLCRACNSRKNNTTGGLKFDSNLFMWT